MDELADIVVVELESVEAHQVLDVAEVPCDEVVHADHKTAFCHEPVAEVGAEEPCGSCNQDPFHTEVARRPMEVYSQPPCCMSSTS